MEAEKRQNNWEGQGAFIMLVTSIGHSKGWYPTATTFKTSIM